MLYHVMSDVIWDFHDMSHYFTCHMSWNRDFSQHGTFMLSCYVMLCHDVMLLCYVIICNLFMLCHVMNYYVMLWIIMSCYDMSFCNVMMSCYAEVVKQVTVLVVTTCESVHSHLLLSPCTALELASCTLQKSFPKIYHQFLSVSLAVQPLKCSTFSDIHPIPIWRFSFNWRLKEEENWVPHEPTKQKWSQISGNSTKTWIFCTKMTKIWETGTF